MAHRYLRITLFSSFTLLTCTYAQLSLGCYYSSLLHLPSPASSSPASPMILAGPHNDVYMSQGACTAYCRAQHALYAITQAGTTCFCSNGPPAEASRVEDAKCDKPCVGYSLETCGSDVMGQEGQGGYVNVMLTRGSHSMVSSSSLSISSANQDMKEQEQEQSSLSPTEPIATSIEGRRESIPSDEVNIGGGDGVASVKVATVGLQPEIRNDSKGESMLTKGKDEEDEEEEGGSSGSEDDGQEDKKESDEDENEGDGNEDEGEGENEGGDDEVERGNTGKSIPGHAGNLTSSSPPPAFPPFTKIPVASTVVAAVCLLGIGSFIVYLAKKRRQARGRARWVDTVIKDNNDPRSVRGGSKHGPSNHSAMSTRTLSRMSYHPNLLEDLESNTSDEQSILERRQSFFVRDSNNRKETLQQQRASILAGETYSRAIHAATLIPAGVTRRSMRDVDTTSAASSSYATAGASCPARGYSHRSLQSPVDAYKCRTMGRSALCNDGVFRSRHYEEYHEPEDIEDERVAGSSHMKDDSYSSAESMSTPVGGGGGVIAEPVHALQPQQRRQYRHSSYRPRSEYPSQHSYRHSHHQQRSHQSQQCFHTYPGMVPVHPHQRASLSAVNHDYVYRPPLASRANSGFPLESPEHEDPFRDAVGHDSHPYFHPRSRTHQQATYHGHDLDEGRGHPLQYYRPYRSHVAGVGGRQGLGPGYHHPHRHSIHSTHRLHSSPAPREAITITRFHSAPASTTAARNRPLVSSYKRPHSFTMGFRTSGGEDRIGQVRREDETFNFRTHVLQDDNDDGGEEEDESEDHGSVPKHRSMIDSLPLNTAMVTSSSNRDRNANASGDFSMTNASKLSTGSLKQHSKRLSTPYVQTIRRQQQQQHQEQHLPSDLEFGLGNNPVRSLSPCIENCTFEGGEKDQGQGQESESENVFDYLIPVPGIAPPSDRTWSKTLLRTMVGNVSSSRDHSQYHYSSNDGEDVEEIHVDADDVDDDTTTGGRGRNKHHRQAHSGSLVSFRGLDDPNDQRLRVMNPDEVMV